MNYSGFGRRLLAYLIDGAILFIPGFIAGRFVSGFGVGIGANLILGFLYYPFFESSILSATPGKALLGMAVLSEAGDRITFKKAVIRYFTRFISALICYIGYIMQAFTARKQALHDLISETIVIDRPSEDLNYFKVWKDEFKSVIERL